MDYDVCENTLLVDEERTKGYQFIYKKDLARWLIMALIGVITALIACSIDITIEEVSNIKYAMLKNLTDRCVADECLSYPFLAWIAWNIIPVFIGAMLVAYIEVTAELLRPSFIVL